MGVAASAAAMAAASCFLTSSFLCLCFFLCSCLIGSFGKILLNWSGNYEGTYYIMMHVSTTGKTYIVLRHARHSISTMRVCVCARACV